MAIAGPTTNQSEIRRWAKKFGAVPIERLPAGVDGEPALLDMMLKEQVPDRPNVRMISWDDFFAKFEALGLSFVYDDACCGYNELLQREGHSPYRHVNHQARHEN